MPRANNDANLKRWPKGVSGNPGGRTPLPPEVKESARSYTLEAIERLVFWMRSDNATASVQSTSLLLDRAWGKPTQPLAGDGEMQPLEILITHTQGVGN